MIRLVSGILDGGENVFAFKAGIILQDLFDGGSCTQQFQNVGDADSHAADTRAVAALAPTLRGHIVSVKPPSGVTVVPEM